MRKFTIRDITARLCFGILLLFMLSILLRFFTRQVLIEKLHIQNRFTELVFWGNEDAGKLFDESEEEQEPIAIDWQELYPFEEDDLKAHPVVNEKKETAMNQLRDSVFDMESRIEVYTGELLIGYMQSVEWMNQIEKAMGWDIASYAEYNGVIELEDGHLTACYGKTDTAENVESTAQLYDYCTEQGIDFLYVQAPSKISRRQDAGVSNSLDFSNQNADELLAGLARGNIPFLDLREEIEKTGVEHHSLFYNTDHHWKIETGLLAADKLAEHLNEQNGFTIDRSLLEKENFEFRLYRDWYLGSYGKKVTLTRTSPDDFTEVYPKYTTKFTYEMPTLGMKEEGDFSVLYDRAQVEEKDYYNNDPYLAYLYGGGPVIRIHNEQIKGKKILFIKDSFAIPVIPFIATGVENVDVLDVREFDGSAKAFIKESQPDMVVVFYSTASVRKIDWPSHLSAFDFR